MLLVFHDAYRNCQCSLHTSSHVDALSLRLAFPTVFSYFLGDCSQLRVTTRCYALNLLILLPATYHCTLHNKSLYFCSSLPRAHSSVASKRLSTPKAPNVLALGIFTKQLSYSKGPRVLRFLDAFVRVLVRNFMLIHRQSSRPTVDGMQV
jgi:hypothetical protein